MKRIKNLVNNATFQVAMIAIVVIGGVATLLYTMANAYGTAAYMGW